MEKMKYPQEFWDIELIVEDFRRNGIVEYDAEDLQIAKFVMDLFVDEFRQHQFYDNQHLDSERMDNDTFDSRTKNRQDKLADEFRKLGIWCATKVQGA